jgi:hypothetical protein
VSVRSSLGALGSLAIGFGADAAAGIVKGLRMGIHSIFESSNLCLCLISERSLHDRMTAYPSNSLFVSATGLYSASSNSL